MCQRYLLAVVHGNLIPKGATGPQWHPWALQEGSPPDGCLPALHDAEGEGRRIPQFTHTLAVRPTDETT